MTRKVPRLIRIDQNEEITWGKHSCFLDNLQRALFLALLEQGLLNTIQYRYIEDKLRQKKLDYAKKIRN